MKVADLEKLKKFMAMTTSDSDPEALTAIRMANKLLNASKINWSQLISKQVTYEMDFGEDASTVNTTPHPSSSMGAPDLAEKHVNAINVAFEKAFRNVKEGTDFHRFLKRLHHDWETNGHLPERAIKAVKNAAMTWAEKKAAGLV